MSADIFTKPFTEKAKWIHARKLIAHYFPNELGIGVTKVNSGNAPIAVMVQGAASHEHTTELS